MWILRAPRLPRMRAALLALWVPWLVVAACSDTRVSDPAGAPGGGAAGASGVAPTEACPPADPDEGGASADPASGGLDGPSQVLSTSHGGLERRYLLAVPEGHDGSELAGLVVSLHGHGSSKEAQEANTALAEVGASRGYVVVTPDAAGDPRAWNFVGAQGSADDFGFIAELVARLQGELCIDPDRTFVAGHSNGSAFAALVACRDPYPFRAVALVSATTPANCGGAAPSVLAIAGTADSQVPYEGGPIGGSALSIPPAEDVVRAYATAYGCASGPTSTEVHPGVTRSAWEGCRDGAAVLLDTVAGGVHAWPGSRTAASAEGNSAAGATYPATDAVLDFFDSHR